VGISPGLVGATTLVVTEADTASAFGSGDVDVLATPRVLALCEAATVAAMHGVLDASQTTVGTHVELDHLRPSTIGATVSARATLTSTHGRRLTFEVAAVEGEHVVARGVVVRAVVDRNHFVRG
jgi:fluoroacetyl-CoA thioesterase